MAVEITNELIENVKKISVEAGEVILEIYQEDIDIVCKDDNSPLTKADLAAHHLICKELKKISDLPILSEESTKIDWKQRSLWETYWLIDPLDGTKEFIKKNGEFTVNIALIDNHIPVLGVVYAPVLETCYWGSQGIGAFCVKNGLTQQLNPSKPETFNALRVVGSRSHISSDMDTFLNDFPHHKIVPKGSSLKLCMVAEGSADIYPRLGLTSEWDTAAGHAVVTASGGIVCKLDGSELLYNAEESILNPYFLVLSKSLYSKMFALN